MPRHMDSRRPAPPTVRFLEDLVRALEESGRPAFGLPRKRTVAWREGNTLNHIELVRWNGSDPGAPRLTRISCNYYSFDPSARTRHRLGFHLPDRREPRRGLTLELTVLDEELVAFAPWLVRWIAGRVDPAVPIPPPPVECHNWHRDWQTTDYAWSAAAWDAQEAWRKQEEEARARREARRKAFLDGLPRTSPASPAPSPTASSACAPGPATTDAATPSQDADRGQPAPAEPPPGGR